MDLTNKLISYTLGGPGITTPTGGNSVTTLESIISTGIGLLTLIGIIYFVVHIILAGYSLISAQGDPKELETSKKRITYNVIGLAIIAIAYGIALLIGSILGLGNFFNLGSILN